MEPEPVEREEHVIDSRRTVRELDGAAVQMVVRLVLHG